MIKKIMSAFASVALIMGVYISISAADINVDNIDKSLNETQDSEFKEQGDFQNIKIDGELDFNTVVDGFTVSLHADSNVFPADIVAEVSQGDKENAKLLIDEQISKNEEIKKLEVFDFSFTANGEELEPQNGYVEVSVKLNDASFLDCEKIAVFHIKDDVAEEIDCRVDDDTVTFMAEKFSDYGLAGMVPAGQTGPSYVVNGKTYYLKDRTEYVTARGVEFYWFRDDKVGIAVGTNNREYENDNTWGSYPWELYSHNTLSDDVLSEIRKVEYIYADWNPTDNLHRAFYYMPNLKKVEFGENFDTSNVVSMASMFEGCNKLESIDVSKFNTSKVKSMSGMFDGCGLLTNLDVSNFNTANVTRMDSMFQGCKSLTSLDITEFNTENVTDMKSMFSGCSALVDLDVTKLNTSNVNNMKHMFSSCKSISDLDVSKFNTSNVTDMGYMFGGCRALENLNLDNFDTKKVTDMQHMFEACISLNNIDLKHFDTSNVNNMNHMFSECDKFTSLDISSFNTEKVTDMSSMFYGCRKLSDIYLGDIKTHNVENMEEMFSNCWALSDIDVSSFNTEKVKKIRNMFMGCDKLDSLDLSNFDLSSVGSDSANPVTEVLFMPQTDNLHSFKTPKKIGNVNIAISKAMYDINDNYKMYKVLPANMSGSLTLVKPLPTFTITYEPNGGAESPFLDHDLPYGLERVIKNNYWFSKAGYIFKSWNTKSDGTGIVYDPSSKLTITENLTLYAQWEEKIEPVNYTVTFNANGGTVTPTTVQVEENTVCNIIPIPTRTGYKYLGWYISNIDFDDVNKWNFSTGKVTSNITLYAGWEKLDDGSGGNNGGNNGGQSGGNGANTSGSLDNTYIKSGSKNVPDNSLKWIYNAIPNNLVAKQEQGAFCKMAFAFSTPLGFKEAFSYNFLTYDTTNYDRKTGEFILFIPHEYRKAGRVFAIIGVNKYGLTTIYPDKDLLDDRITIDLDASGYAFDLIYKDGVENAAKTVLNSSVTVYNTEGLQINNKRVNTIYKSDETEKASVNNIAILLLASDYNMLILLSMFLVVYCAYVMVKIRRPWGRS